MQCPDGLIRLPGQRRRRPKDQPHKKRRQRQLDDQRRRQQAEIFPGRNLADNQHVAAEAGDSIGQENGRGHKSILPQPHFTQAAGNDDGKQHQQNLSAQPRQKQPERIFA